MSKTDRDAAVILTGPRRPSVPPPGLGFVLLLTDGMILALLGWVIPDVSTTPAGPALVVGLTLVLLVKPAFGLYTLPPFDHTERTRRTLLAAALCTALLTALAAVAAGLRPLVLPVLTATLGGLAVTFVTGAVVMLSALLVNPRWRTPAVIVGAGDEGAALAQKLERLPWLGIRPIAFVDDDQHLWQTRVAGLPVIGPVSDLATASLPAGVAQARTIIIADPRRCDDKLNTIIDRLPFRQICWIMAGCDVRGREASYNDLNGTPVLSIDTQACGLYPRSRRVVDIILSGILLVLVAPLMGAIAVAIRFESPGPVLFRQVRWAGAKATFDVLKFRSMHENAEEQLKRVLATSAELRQEYEIYHKLRIDPRITRVGHFLRRTSLDELPQLWNVLMGDMSLIGPRAYMPSELPEVGEAARLIGCVPPGLTGYWQVSGRHRTTFQERVAMDIFYVHNAGPALDTFILFKTAFIVLSGDGA
jgi:Undecaprenyl-phosphate galactose phosphotransferase WbaP